MSDSAPPWRLHHFGISTADLDKTAAWYRDRLGLDDDFSYEVPEMGLRARFLSGASFRLEIFEMADVAPLPSDQARLDRYLSVRGLKHVALAVDDLDAAVAWLQSRDVRFALDGDEVPSSGGERFAFVEAPDGVLLEIYEPHHSP